MNFIYNPSLVLYLPLYQLDGASFMSRDAYGHPCMVTGASWQRNGRLFDGIDDLVNASPVTTVYNFGGDFTLLAWAKLTNWAGNKSLVSVGLSGDDDNVQIYYRDALNAFRADVFTTAGGQNIVDSSGTFDGDSNFHFFALAVDLSGHIIRFVVDATNYGSDATNVIDASAFNACYIGQKVHDSPNVNIWQGTIGEVLIYNKLLTLTEMESARLATKWRYG